MRCEATSLARTLSFGLRCKIAIFRATFRAPRKRFFGPPILHVFVLSAVSEEFGHIFRAPENIFRAGIRAPEKGLADAVLGNPRQKKIGGTKMIGTTWACAVLFFPALPERPRWLRGLDCHTVSLATTCRLSTQTRHLTGESRWTCRNWVTNFLPQKRPIRSTTDPTPQKFPSDQNHGFSFWFQFPFLSWLPRKKWLWFQEKVVWFLVSILA